MWSLPVDVLFTAVFAATGGYSLLRWAGLRAGSIAAGDQLAELSHLLMSLAMIAMTWRPSGVMGSVVQVVAFGAFTGYFATHIWRGPRRMLATYHLAMCAAMVWMVVTMPMLMAGAASSGSSMSGMDMPGMRTGSGGDVLVAGPAPAWVKAATFGAAALMFASAGAWLRQVLQRDTHATRARRSADQRAGSWVAVPRSTTAITASTSAFSLFGRRTAACCHLLMSSAMAVMLLLMV